MLIEIYKNNIVVSIYKIILIKKILKLIFICNKKFVNKFNYNIINYYVILINYKVNKILKEYWKL